jgi:hypothetical protein
MLYGILENRTACGRIAVMTEIAIKAEDLRLPAEARDALEGGACVLITRYGKPTSALLKFETYALVAPLLELIQAGVVISPEMLMTIDDIELARDLADDTETTSAEAAMIEGLLAQDSEPSAG